MRVPSLIQRPASPPPPSAAAAEGHVEVWREQGQVCAYGFEAEGESWMELPNLATFRLGDEVVAFPEPSASPALVRDAFERSVLPMAMHLLGGEALHASGVLGPVGVVALCGESGTGKSTLAGGLGARGHLRWADDAVAFEPRQPGVLAFPLPFEDATERSPAPLAAVVVLRRHRAEPVSVRRLEGGEAFGSVLEQGYCFRPGDAERRKEMVGAYLELVARVAAYEVRFVAEWEHFDALADAVEQILVGG